LPSKWTDREGDTAMDEEESQFPSRSHGFADYTLVPARRYCVDHESALQFSRE
jgi:hypothetical protein